jgi:signal peptidase
MEPTYYTGDLVVSRCGEPQVGDVVVYTPPGMEEGRIIHRVIAGSATDGWVIQGDNNDFLDPWRPGPADVIGIARLHVPGLGKVAAILLDPWAWVSIIVVAAGVLLWPTRTERPTTGAGADEPADAEPEPADGPVAEPVEVAR